MIGYFDTSAIVPLVVAEPGSRRCAELWQACDVVASSLLAVAEAHAALAQALRLGRLTASEHGRAASILKHRLDECDLIVPTRGIVDHAARLALLEALRGYDAVHLASALTLRTDGIVLISGDQTLLGAAASAGLALADTAAARS